MDDIGMLTGFSFLWLVVLLIIAIGLPQLDKLPGVKIWASMDRFAFWRPTFVKYYVLVMSYLAAVRVFWYSATWLAGQPDPNGPFVLYLGILPPSMAQFPFPWLLPAEVFPIQAWFLITFLGVVFTIYGWLGLPEEGLNRAVTLPNKVRPALFYLGFHTVWIMLTIARLTPA